MKKEKIIYYARKFYLVNIISAVLRFLNPHYSYCEKCKLPWNWCESKTVYTSSHRGTFATCQFCWDNSTLQELQLYYRDVYIRQFNSLRGTGSEMDHTLNHLLNCVEIEYNQTHH